MSIVGESKWGIDLGNRKMKYAPWTIDEYWMYVEPGEDDKDKVYGISGEAVRESLIYFEKCGGDTGKLVELLNSHIIDNKYIIDRDELLDSRRWYNNEYYFYFQMFCKKIIGRYDWRFGEGKNEQLSRHHKIYENGKFKFVPFGGKYKQINHAIISGFIEYYISRNIDFSDYFDWIKSISRGVTDLDYKSDLYKIRDFWVSGEFGYYFYEFMKIILNFNNLRYCVEEGLHKYSLQIFTFFPSVMVLNAIFLILKRTSPILRIKIDKINSSKYNFCLSASEKSMKDSDRYEMLGFYKKSVFFNVNNLFIGMVKKVIKTSLNMNSFPIITEQSNIDENFVKFTVSWKNKSNVFPLLFSLNVAIQFIVWAVVYFDKRPISETVYFFIIMLLFNGGLILLKTITSLRNERKENNSNIINIIEDGDKKINDLKNISERLVKEKILLKKKVKQRTRELEKANEELKGLDKAKTNFFANVSHELRTPLTMIISPISDISSGKFGENIDRKNKIFSSIEKNALRLLRLINNILDFTKIEDGRFQINNRTVDIVNLLKIYLSQIESFAVSKGINLKFNCSVEKLICSIDIDKLETAIFNLLSNAIKFSNPGGKVSVNLTANDSEFEISVVDNGIGIENVDKVFNRFYQESSELNRKYEGTGIGLALTKEIVDILGGRIICESVRGVGTSFRIILPLNRGETSEIEQNDIEVREYQLADFDYQPKYSVRSFNGKFKNILLLEDNDELSEYIAEKLSEFYNVEKASNGIKGLEKIAEYKPDIILSDIMMPEMDGVEFYREIHKNESYQNIPFIFVSARADDKERAEILKTGAMDYITKPINFNELFEKINNLLNIRDGIKNELKSKIISNIGELMDREDKRKTFDYDKILTDREKEIVKHIIEGKQNKEIAYALNLSERTIENHLSKYNEPRI